MCWQPEVVWSREGSISKQKHIKITVTIHHKVGNLHLESVPELDSDQTIKSGTKHFPRLTFFNRVNCINFPFYCENERITIR